MKRVLVTGASGFVGSHLSHYLHGKCQRLFGSYFRRCPKSSSGVQYLKCNFANSHSVKKLLETTRPTHVFHLVGQSSPSFSWQEPHETMVQNALSALHLVESCRKLRMKPRILFISSAHVYGRTCLKRSRPSERDAPEPMDPYGASKLIAESIVLQYWKECGIPSIVIRAMAHIGPGQSPIFAISNFSKQIAETEKRNRPAVIRVGNLTAERGFVAIDDMLNAYMAAMQKGEIGEIYNVGVQRTRPMRYWLEEVLKLTHRKMRIVEDSKKAGVVEIKRLLINSSKFRRATGWREASSATSVIPSILNWWRDHV